MCKNENKEIIFNINNISFSIVNRSIIRLFSLEITGNDTAKYNTITTGDLKLTFTDTNVLTLDDALPGDSVTKTISVKNTGTIDTSYNIVWQELTNLSLNS